MKLTLRQLRSLSDTDYPYFCSTCLSSEIPFSNVTNTHIDTFNSLDAITHILNICTECHKEINHKDQLKCKLGNHFIHKKCSNSNLNDINHSTWSCKNCKLFPFDDLNDNDLIENLITANQEQVKRRAKIKLINRIEELKTILPNIEIPDPMNDDPHDNPVINFNYYEINKLIKLTSNIKQENHMSFFHSNIRSYDKNFDELDTLLCKIPYKFDIIGLTETWDSPGRTVTPETIETYHRAEKTQGSSQNGGVIAYIRDSIEYTRREDLEIKINSGENNIECESIFIEIMNSPKEKFVVGIVYRHPNGKISNFNERLQSVLEKINKERKQIVLMGDFNINLINTSQHRDTNEFLDLIFTNCLTPYITQPTRFDKNLKATLIDNIFYNDICKECVSGNLISHVSDHLPNFLFLPAEKNKASKKEIRKRDFSSFSLNEFKQDLLFTDLDNKLSKMDDPSLMYDYFHSTLSLLFEIHCPIKKLNRSEKKTITKTMDNKINP